MRRANTPNSGQCSDIFAPGSVAAVSVYTAVAVFAAGALIGAGAPNIETLVFGRILQGFAAGLVQPLVLAAVVAAFPSGRRGMAVGLYGMAVTLAPSSW